MRNNENLIKLAKYLWDLPENYEHFDMRIYNGYGNGPDDCIKPSGYCGTAACAVGHEPAAGIIPKKNQEYWHHYLEQEFISSDADYEWCFSCTWTKIDNTPKGAAQRIIYMLVHDNIDADVEVEYDCDDVRLYERLDISELDKFLI